MPSPALRDPTPETHRVGSPVTPGPDPIPGPFLLTTALRAQTTSARWLEHSHPVDELLWVRDGALEVRVGGAAHLLCPSRGLLVPAGAVHASRVTTAATIGATSLRPRLASAPTPVRVDRALSELLRHLNDTPMPAAERLSAQRVCLDLIRRAPRLRPGLRLPDDPRIRRIAAALLDDPADDRSLAEWAGPGSSVSTITRAFVADTGLSFAAWRRRARIDAATAALLAGLPVAAAGRRVGYHSASAFVTAFRSEAGTTPGGFLREQAASPGTVASRPERDSPAS